MLAAAVKSLAGASRAARPSLLGARALFSSAAEAAPKEAPKAKLKIPTKRCVRLRLWREESGRATTDEESSLTGRPRCCSS